MELSYINPFVRYARGHRDLRIKPKNSICYDCRLFFVRQGSGQLMVDGKQYDFFDNTVIFLPPKTCYRFLPKQGSGILSVLVFNFDLVDGYSQWKDSLGTASEEDFCPEKSPAYPVSEPFSREIFQSAPQLYERLQGCVKDFLAKTPFYREMASAELKACLLELLRLRLQGSDGHITAPVTEYIHSHYQDASLTNGMIAEHFGYHPYYLSQVVKNATGKTMHNYLLYYRIRVAKNYLITTELDVDTVSWKCGFNSCAYFIKQFRQQTGMTPKQYRTAHLDQAY